MLSAKARDCEQSLGRGIHGVVTQRTMHVNVDQAWRQNQTLAVDGQSVISFRALTGAQTGDAAILDQEPSVVDWSGS